jgi:hypothetical protein
MSAWWEDDPGRLTGEKMEMAVFFPGFELRRDGDTLYWIGTLISDIGGCPYRVLVAYPDRFPYEAPKAFILEPEIPHSPHRWSDGSLCLFDPNDRSVTSEITAAKILGWTGLWIFCQEHWEAAGGEERLLSTGGEDKGYEFWPSEQVTHHD